MSFMQVTRCRDLVALVEVAVEAGAAGAVNGPSVVDGAGFESGQGDDRLEGGAGRELGLDGAVQQGIVGVAGDFLPVGGLDADGEFVGVEAGAGGHGEDLAVVRIEGDDRAAAAFQREFGDHLEIEVDGELEVFAGGGVLDAEDLALAAAVVDDGLAFAIDAHQDVVVLLLDAGLADDLALVVLGVLGVVEFGFADFAGVADDVGDDAVFGVEAALRLDELHFGEGLGVAVRFDEGEFAGREVLFDDDGLVLGAALEAVEAAHEVVVIEVEAVGDFVDVLRLETFAGKHEAPGGVVIDDDAAIAVEDFAAGRDDGQGFDAVAFGAFVVDFGIFDLQIPETGDEEEEDGDGGVLERGHFRGGEAGVVARFDLDLRRVGFGGVGKSGVGHGTAVIRF